jgi:transcriptional regulator GlxA family with amidase domain
VLRVGLILPAGFHVMSYAALAAFETANFIAGERFYEVSIVSEGGGLVPNSFGAATETEPLDIRPFDTLLVGAGFAAAPPLTPRLLTFLREAVTDGRRVASICFGTFILAEAGILDGRRATTHWALARELEQRFPKIRVEIDRIFIADGPVWTSAGMTAGIDMALGLVERDLGGARPCDRQDDGRSSSTCRRTVAALGDVRTRREIRPRPERARLRQKEPSTTSDR